MQAKFKLGNQSKTILYWLLLVVGMLSGAAFATDIDRTREAALKGDAAAQYSLGVSYFSGTKFPGDENIGIDWLKRSAEQGYAKAQLALGLQYNEGKYVGRNPVEAMKWFQLAANQGDSEAQFKLGVGYRSGQGVNKDVDKGMYWLRRSVDQSNAHAQVAIALMYLMGDGVKQDVPQALKWAKLSADQGDAFAQYLLGITYLHGKVVDRNVDAGLRLLKLSADQDNPLAIGELRKYSEQQKSTAAIKQTNEHIKKYMETRPSQDRASGSAPVVFTPSALPSPRPAAPLPSSLVDPYSCPYGTCGNGGASSSAGPSRLGESAGLYKQEGAGGGYLTCHYSTGAGYRFTTTSSGSSCPGNVTVDPQSGQAW